MLSVYKRKMQDILRKITLKSSYMMNLYIFCTNVKNMLLCNRKVTSHMACNLVQYACLSLFRSKYFVITKQQERSE